MEPGSKLPCLEEKSPPLIPILSQTKPTLILPFYLLKLSVFIIVVIITYKHRGTKIGGPHISFTVSSKTNWIFSINKLERNKNEILLDFRLQ
jgi:hypothetical protein